MVGVAISQDLSLLSKFILSTLTIVDGESLCHRHVSEVFQREWTSSSVSLLKCFLCVFFFKESFEMPRDLLKCQK